MIIVESAFYGSKDVTNTVQSIIDKPFRVSNSLFGDGDVGKFKQLVVKHDNRVKVVDENQMFVLSNNPNLAIYYTNNQNEKLVELTLDTIYENLINTDLIICSKTPVRTNWINILSKLNNHGHLSINTQILQCLLYGNEINPNYNKVFFLEHDVLYPEGYFDFDSTNLIDCNQNYIGLKYDGFQIKEYNHQPLHQLIMDFQYALKHFKNLEMSYLIDKSALLEPIDIIKNYDSKNPCVHINHGHNFTSHFSIYSETTTPNNDYWGNYKSYKYL